jgi:hypothetical protein
MHFKYAWRELTVVLSDPRLRYPFSLFILTKTGSHAELTLYIIINFVYRFQAKIGRLHCEMKN